MAAFFLGGLVGLAIFVGVVVYCAYKTYKWIKGKSKTTLHESIKKGMKKEET